MADEHELVSRINRLIGRVTDRDELKRVLDQATKRDEYLREHWTDEIDKERVARLSQSTFVELRKTSIGETSRGRHVHVSDGVYRTAGVSKDGLCLRVVDPALHETRKRRLIHGGFLADAHPLDEKLGELIEARFHRPDEVPPAVVADRAEEIGHQDAPLLRHYEWVMARHEGSERLPDSIAREHNLATARRVKSICMDSTPEIRNLWKYTGRDLWPLFQMNAADYRLLLKGIHNYGVRHDEDVEELTEVLNYYRGLPRTGVIAETTTLQMGILP